MVVDAPPLCGAEARVLLPRCDGAILVTRMGLTHPGDAEESVAGVAGVRWLGAVVNGASVTARSRSGAAVRLLGSGC